LGAVSWGSTDLSILRALALERFAAASAREAAPGTAMRQSIGEIEAAFGKLGKGSPWDPGVRASVDFLNPLFRDYSSSPWKKRVDGGRW